MKLIRFNDLRPLPKSLSLPRPILYLNKGQSKIIFLEQKISSFTSVLNLCISQCVSLNLFNIYFFKSFLNFYATTVIPISPLPSSAHPTPPLPQSIPTLLSMSVVIHTCSLSRPSPFLPSLWLLSVCSLFPSLWFYFVPQFILFIRFLLQVKSYGICLSPTGLFHVA